MLKKIVIFYFLLISCHCHAHLLKVYDYELWNKAIDHKKQAIGEFWKLEYLLKYIPDPKDRQHMKDLISSSIDSDSFSFSISSFATQNPRGILVEGLSLLSSIPASYCEEMLEIKNHLTNAAYHT